MADSRARSRSLELTLAEFGIDEKHWTTAKNTENINATNSKSANKRSPPGVKRTSFGTTLDQMEQVVTEARQFRLHTYT